MRKSNSPERQRSSIAVAPSLEAHRVHNVEICHRPVAKGNDHLHVQSVYTHTMQRQGRLKHQVALETLMTNSDAV
jgi:hypothetical protein